MWPLITYNEWNNLVIHFTYRLKVALITELYVTSLLAFKVWELILLWFILTRLFFWGGGTETKWSSCTVISSICCAVRAPSSGVQSSGTTTNSVEWILLSSFRIRDFQAASSEGFHFYSIPNLQRFVWWCYVTSCGVTFSDDVNRSSAVDLKFNFLVTNHHLCVYFSCIAGCLFNCMNREARLPAAVRENEPALIPPKERLDAGDFLCWLNQSCDRLQIFVTEIITSKQKVLPWSIAWRSDFDSAEALGEILKSEGTQRFVRLFVTNSSFNDCCRRDFASSRIFSRFFRSR